MKYIDDFVQYFEYLCTVHPLLLHAPESGQQVFEVKNVEEAFGAFRTGAIEKGYFVRMILPTMRMGGHSKLVKGYQFGLMFAKHYSRREDERNASLVALSDAERVADQFISRIISDSQEGLELFGGYSNNADSLDISGDCYLNEGDGSYSAVLYMFNVSADRNILPLCQAIEWTDGGVTPP